MEMIVWPMRHQNGNCLPCGGFCLAVSREVCKALRTAFESSYYSGIAESVRDMCVTDGKEELDGGS